MSLTLWWQRKSGPAKVVTTLATLLIVQMGLCFASPGEPSWFDRLFHIKPSQYELRVGLVVVEAYLCIATFILLLIALIIQVVRSWRTHAPDRVTPSGTSEKANIATDQDSGDSQ
jgi:hypothetical protein